MAATKSLDVLIIGAGPVGLALALDLGRRGVRSTIIERNAGVGSELQAKASVINERTMEFLRLLGVNDDIAHAGFPDDLPGDTVFCTALNNGKLVGRLEMASAETREVPEQCCEMLRRCPQFWFDPALERAVQRQGKAHIRYGVEFIGLEQDGDGVTCSVRRLPDGKEEKINTKYLVACDGPASDARKALNIPFEGKELGFSVSAIIRIDLNSHHTLGKNAERYMFIGPSGTWGNFTTIDGRTLWRFSVVGMDEKADPATLDLNPQVRQALGRDDIDYEILKVVSWRRSQYTAGSYHKGRVFLAGDSAHTMSPTGGHGLNTGMGDVMTLSWILKALLDGWGGNGLINAYGKERRPIAIRNGTTSTRNYSIWVEKVGRDKVLDDGPEADEQRRALGQMMASNLRQEFQALGLALGYNYADSPIVISDGSSAPEDEPDIYVQTSRPGHRAPHYWLKEGESTIDKFGDGFVLLRLGEEEHRDQEILDAAAKNGFPLQILSWTDPYLMELYERRLILVRPDGMVAWRGNSLPENVNELIDRVRGVEN